ncbi:MAG: TssN family type VI secretion system protein [Chitinophagales bacterium]
MTEYILTFLSLNDAPTFFPYVGALAGTLILGLLIFRIWKKTKIFKDSFSLLVIFTLLFFGIVTFLGYRFEFKIGFTYIYYILITLSLTAGIVYTIVIHTDKVSWAKVDGFWKEFLVSLAILIGILIIALIIMLAAQNDNVSKTDPWMLLALIPYIMPLVFYKSFVFFMKVPSQKFKTWKYPVGRSIPRIELVDTTLIHVDLNRMPNDLDKISTKIRAPRHERFGDLFFYFLHKYNIEKHPDTKIDIYLNYDEQTYYEWIFYLKQNSGVTKSKQYFDPDLKIVDLELKENQHIIAERVL